MDQRAIGIAAALASAASWALGSILFRKLGERLTPAALTFAKGLVGTALLGAVAASTGFDAISLNAMTMLIISGLLGIALGDTLFFKALNNLGAHALVVMLTLGQVLTVLLAVVWLGERPGPFEWLGIVLVVVGVTVVLWVRLSEGSSTSNPQGVLWGLAAISCMAISTIIAKEALEQTDSVQAAFIRMFAGTIAILIFATPTQGPRELLGALAPLKEWRFALLFLASVFVVTFGGFWLSLLAIKKIDVVLANTLGSTEPLFVLPLAVWLLKEKISLSVVGGTILAMLGVFLLLKPG